MIRYSKLTIASDGTVYSKAKGNTIERRGETVIVTHEGYARTVHVPWNSVREADVLEDDGDGNAREWRVWDAAIAMWTPEAEIERLPRSFASEKRAADFCAEIARKGGRRLTPHHVPVDWPLNRKPSLTP